MNVGIGTEVALFPGKEYIMEISFAVRATDKDGKRRNPRVKVVIIEILKQLLNI
jgi:hypothetical protein